MFVKYTIAAILSSLMIGNTAVLPYSYDINPSPIQTSISASNQSSALSDSSNSDNNDVSEIGDYVLNIEEFNSSRTIMAGKAKKIGVENKYGYFSVEANNDLLPKKYTFSGKNSNNKYLIKGTAQFSKVDITFDGYFLVDNSLTGKKKGQVTLYKGKLDLPNGDKYDGTLDSGKYYSNGTYTWKNGMSYKGKFTNTNKLGSSSLKSDSSNYGYFYFDKNKKKYLYIRFVNSVPTGSGYYFDNGKKYSVKYDQNGNCIYTAKASK